MNKYKFIVRDYHAIKEAEIKIDGITVLSGINGCGKSTLSRWLYYLINGAKEFDNFLYADYKEKISRIINRMQIACMDLSRFKRMNDHIQGKYTLDKLYEAAEKLKTLKVYSNEQVENVQDLFLQALHTTTDFLSETLTGNIPDARKSRIFNYFNMDVQGNDIHQAIEDFSERNERLIGNLTSKLYQNIEERPYQTFVELINKYFDNLNDAPSSIQLDEDGVNVMEGGHIATLFGLQNAIYIDTPMAIGAGDTENIFWNALREMMVYDKPNKNLSNEEKKFLLRIKDLLDGETILEEDDFLGAKDLRYISKDKKINIFLKDAATGFKTFSYLQRLLENGYLNEETLLMIDEPEAHLHPQWVVEFARLLVLLNKKLGLKIMLASHNPDMVAAIHDIANKEGVLANTNFYVAQQESPDNHQYVYKDLEHEIGEIFESFNIALENINRYGRVDL